RPVLELTQELPDFLCELSFAIRFSKDDQVEIGSDGHLAAAEFSCSDDGEFTFRVDASQNPLDRGLSQCCQSSFHPFHRNPDQQLAYAQPQLLCLDIEPQQMLKAVIVIQQFQLPPVLGR